MIENIYISDVIGTQYANKIRRVLFAIGKKYDIPKEEILRTAGKINVSIYNTLNKRLSDYKKMANILFGIDSENIEDIPVLRRIHLTVEGILNIDEEKKTMKPENFRIEVKYPITVVVTEELSVPEEEQTQEMLDRVESTQDNE